MKIIITLIDNPNESVDVTCEALPTDASIDELKASRAMLLMSRVYEFLLKQDKAEVTALVE